MGSPTGISTKAFVWVRAFQLFFAAGSFIVGCVELARWPLIFGLLLPNAFLTVVVLFDTVLYYKKRYAQGAGRASTLRWMTDFAILLILGACIPVIFITEDGARSAVASRFGPYNFQVMFTIIMLTFTCVSLSLFLSTFIMLCVEDARLRKRGRTLPPSATEPMPSPRRSMYQESQRDRPSSALVGAERAAMLVDNLLANGYTLQQLEKMGAARSDGGRDYELDPPGYKA